jgi:hypothetical protein
VEVTAMRVKVILSIFLAVFIFDGYVVIRERVQGSAGADFTYASRVGTTSDNKLEIENSITNNSTQPLAIRWDDAGIVCNGFFQLDPKDVQSNKSMAQEPYIYDHSEIKYGNGMQYSANARCYKDGQARPKDKTQTSITRRDAEGNERYKIEVSSEVSQDRRSANLNFRIKGKLSLIVSSRVGAALKTITKGGNWEVIKTRSLDGFNIQEEDRKTIQAWLDKTPVPKREVSSSDFVVLLNKNEHNNEISLPLIGDDWGLEQIYVIAYVPNTLGILGFTADIYLPE